MSVPPPPLWFAVQLVALVGLLAAQRWCWAIAVGTLFVVNLLVAARSRG